MPNASASITERNYRCSRVNPVSVACEKLDLTLYLLCGTIKASLNTGRRSPPEYKENS